MAMPNKRDPAMTSEKYDESREMNDDLLIRKIRLQARLDTMRSSRKLFLTLVFI